MKTAIVFSGQGAQYPGMMRDLVQTFEEAKEVFRLAGECLGRDIYDITMNAEPETLAQTTNTQPCLMTCELAALRVLKTIGLQYEATIGFSLGEWAALVAAGCASERDVLTLVEKRGAAMQRAVPVGQGGMVAVLGKDEAFIQTLCQEIGDIAPANYNCPGNITVAGTARAVDAFIEAAQAQDVMVSRVAVSIPSHCDLMEPAVEELSPLIRAIPMSEPNVELVMNATGMSTIHTEEIKDNLIKQLSCPVMFQQSVEHLLNSGYDAFVEIGPGKTLSTMIKRTAKGMKKKVQIMQFHDLQTVQAVKELCQ